jgi:hypothetical protein
MKIRAEDGTVCFDWRVFYPACGCFKLVQRGATDFELRRTTGSPVVIKYAIEP